MDQSDGFGAKETGYFECLLSFGFPPVNQKTRFADDLMCCTMLTIFGDRCERKHKTRRLRQSGKYSPGNTRFNVAVFFESLELRVTVNARESDIRVASEVALDVNQTPRGSHFLAL